MVSLMTAQWLRDNDIKARSIADWPATRMRHVQSHDCTVTWEFDRKRVRSIADWPEPGRDTVSHTTVQTSDYLYWNQLDGTSKGLYPLNPPLLPNLRVHASPIPCQYHNSSRYIVSKLFNRFNILFQINFHLSSSLTLSKRPRSSLA